MHPPRSHLSSIARRMAWWWCMGGVLLTMCQPFLAAHFRVDGWEDEPGFRIRAGDLVRFEADDRQDHPDDRETTLFVSPSASVDLPDAFQNGIDGLMALVLLILPLSILLPGLVPPAVRERPDFVPTRGGAPPPVAPWQRLPPQTAPPLTT
ncbi:hypothetical protein ACSFA3_15745 [Variovorax sp. RHLX14]|uniref:hypothetical protein n=1 Tax=Variovorax sp. RHLX14 TaxID=1259731 RepID=UPI003F453A84